MEHFVPLGIKVKDSDSPRDSLSFFISANDDALCVNKWQTDASRERSLKCDKCHLSFHVCCTALPVYELVKYVRTNLHCR